MFLNVFFFVVVVIGGGGACDPGPSKMQLLWTGWVTSLEKAVYGAVETVPLSAFPVIP